MADYSGQYPISKMSKVFKVSRSGYYSWLGREPSKRARQNDRLRRLIHDAWQESGKSYGSPRIYNQLKGDGCAVSRPRVARLMANMGIASRIRKQWVKTTHSTHGWPVAPNLLDRKFAPDGLGRVWVSDITYIRSEQGWLYLTTVMDLGDRQIIGWSLSDGMSAKETSIAAFNQAAERRPPDDHLMFHSDRGVQYACSEFTERLTKHHITQSMSRKGNCWDNAPAESFFKTLKHEMNMPDCFQSYEQARSAIFEFIDIWYNRKRLHSALDYQSPVQAEETLKQKHAA